MMRGKNEKEFAAVKTTGKALYTRRIPEMPIIYHIQHKRTRNGTAMKAR